MAILPAYCLFPEKKCLNCLNLLETLRVRVSGYKKTLLFFSDVLFSSLVMFGATKLWCQPLSDDGKVRASVKSSLGTSSLLCPLKTGWHQTLLTMLPKDAKLVPVPIVQQGVEPCMLMKPLWPTNLHAFRPIEH